MKQTVFAALLLAVSANAMAEATSKKPAQTATAIFAGGCFWCVEADFEKLEGVIAAESGYTGGSVANPTYEEVSAGRTGHTEAVKLTYDPTKVTYESLVEFFWRHIDPTVKDQQFCDHGSQYRSAIFWGNDQERAVVEKSRDALMKSGQFAKIYTEIGAASTFYSAEEYHQDYYKKNPVRYNYYRFSCGRDERVKEVWAKQGS